VVLALCAFVVLAAASHTEEQYQYLFKHFIKQHNKHYHVDEFHVRYFNFKKNLDLIKAHNDKKEVSYKMAVNTFADLTSEEFRSKYLGYNMVERSYIRSKNVVVEAPNATLPTSIDWVAKGAVTPIKNQGQCGSCWSFSTTGSFEGAHFLATGSLVSFSEQQLVDCSSAQGNQGCNGGLMDQAFEYIIANKGLCTEAAYPYTGVDGTCTSTSCKSAGTISSYTDVTPNSESALQVAVAARPVSIAIEADQNCFQFYTSGVLDDATCGTTLDHGVLAVGYGTDAASGKQYWKVKNSWGASWGAAGYINIVRGVTGPNASARQCGLTSDPSYPVV